jgi:hypothetical protein
MKYGSIHNVVESLGFFRFVFSPNRFVLESFLPLIQFLLPEFILENFELASIDRPDGVFHVYIEEKNVDENDPERKIYAPKASFRQ